MGKGKSPVLWFVFTFFNLPGSLKRTRVDSDDEPLMVDVAVPEVGYVVIILLW